MPSKLKTTLRTRGVTGAYTAWERRQGHVMWGEPYKPLNLVTDATAWVRKNSGPYVVSVENSFARQKVAEMNGQLASTQSQAYAKFLNKAYDAASWLLAFAERKEAVRLIVNSAIRLRRAYQALRKGRFRQFLKQLGSRPLPKHAETRWSRPKDAANLWLEYHFGWEPTVKDIYSSVDILQSDYPKDVIVKASRARKGIPVKGSLGEITSSSYWDWDFVGSTRVGYQASISCDNPNLFLANQLGLVNPVGFVYELIPFSFLVDWFANVGQVLSMWSDWVGLTLKNSMTTTKVVLEGSERWKSFSNWFEASSRACVFSRTTGITLPSLTWTRPDGLSVSRAATAISLLVGTLKG